MGFDLGSRELEGVALINGLIHWWINGLIGNQESVSLS
jgi:hypothetical protein